MCVPRAHNSSQQMRFVLQPKPPQSLNPSLFVGISGRGLSIDDFTASKLDIIALNLMKELFANNAFGLCQAKQKHKVEALWSFRMLNKTHMPRSMWALGTGTPLQNIEQYVAIVNKILRGTRIYQLWGSTAIRGLYKPCRTLKYD